MATEYNRSGVVVYDRYVSGSAPDGNPGVAPDGLQDQIDSLDTRLGAAEGDITSLDGRVTVNEGDIAVLQVGGWGVLVNTGSDYVIDSQDWTVNCTDAVTVTLPTAVGIQGKEFRIKNSAGASDVVGVDTTSSQGIDGVTSGTTLNQYQCLVVQSDGADWVVISGP